MSLDKNEMERISHPSFGMLRFSRVNGRTPYFFGSELPQEHYIAMELCPGEVEKTLSKDWYYAKPKPIISVRMTSNQFAELITSLNMGSGVPCTIEYKDGVHIPEMENKPETSKEFTHRKFKDRMKEFAQTLNQYQKKSEELIKKKTLSKDDQLQLNNIISHAIQEISSNIPFFLECFQENMDKVVLEAKNEVESAILHKVTALGLQKLYDEQRLIE